MYDVPGRADPVSQAVKEAWNAFIEASFNRLRPFHPKSLLVLDPATLPNNDPTRAVRWAGNPAVPLACLGQDEDLTRKLCDFGVRGRHELHNEYLEYMTLFREDSDQQRRPKRVVMSTELREYWTTLAVHDPSFMKQTAEAMLHRTIGWDEFYGPGVSDPAQLSDDDRLRRFSIMVAGDGGGLVTGVASQPQGSLNRDHILFMTHPINGLDDLVFIVMFGAKAYVVRNPDGTTRDPTKFEIFGDGNSLACRNADPAAALGASAVARQGRNVAFANPLGMYIFTEPTVLRQSFLLDEEPIPEEWIQLSRGEPGMQQRLEFGPPDDDEHFLDDIKVVVGAEELTLIGGYDVASRVEVGPLLLVGDERVLQPEEFVPREPVSMPTPCSQSQECPGVRALRIEFENQDV